MSEEKMNQILQNQGAILLALDYLVRQNPGSPMIREMNISSLKITSERTAKMYHEATQPTKTEVGDE